MLVVHPPARAIVNRTIRSHVGSRAVSVLEAGGGSRSRLQQFGGITISSITTIDIDAEQLRRNDYADEKILGDLQSFKFDRRYDIIEIVNVIEHIEDLDAALRNVAEACQSDGIIIIGAPYIYSLAGFITKFSPHAIHVLFRKHVLGEPNAGKEGYPPFPTFYNPLIAPRRLKEFFAALGFRLQLELYYDIKRYDKIWKRLGIVSFPLFLIVWLVNLITPKHYDTRSGDYYMVFHRPPTV